MEVTQPEPVEELDSAMQFAAESAIRDLYDEHGSTLLRYLLRLVRGDRHRAEDILQETLMRAWRHPEAVADDGTWSRPWLFTVARRIAIDHLRAQVTRPTELQDVRLEERAEEDDPVEQLINRAEVRAAVASLPDRLRDVLIEVYLRERSVNEAAEILKIPAGTVKSRTFYALRALREEMERRGFELPHR